MRPEVSRPEFCWEYVARGGAATSADAAAVARGRLEAALRAAHGLAGPVRLTIVSGPAPAIRLGTSSPEGRRWFERGLAAAYDPGRWRPVVPEVTPSAVERFARRRRLPGVGAPPSESPSPLDALLAGWSSLPVGVALRVELLAQRVHGLDRWLERLFDVTAPAVPSGPRSGPEVRPARPGPTAAPASPNLLWLARISLAFAPSISSAERSTGRGIAEAALARLDGYGVRFDVAPILARPGGRQLLALRELAGLLPDPAGRGVEATPPGAVGGGSLALGRSYRGDAVGLPVEPTQGRHLAVIGETGMGKSSLLVALARRASALGGVVVFDPLGETGEEIVREFGGPSDRLLWIAPSRSRVGLNALAGAHPGDGAASAVRAERSLTDLVHALRRVRSGRYADGGFWGPRLEEMLTRALRAAAAFPDGTLADAHTLLATGGLTRRPVPPAARDVVAALAQRVRERPDDADGARRLLLEIVQNPTLDSMLCARSPTVRASDLVEPGRLVVVNGDAATVGESTARYLLAVYLAILWAALLARPGPAKTFVLLDEAQWFAHESLVEMLRVSRRLNVHLVVSTQSIASLPEPVREAVRTNVADVVAFRGLADDARELARWAPGAAPERLLALSRGEAAVFLGKGAAVHWVRTARRPPAPPVEIPRVRAAGVLATDARSGSEPCAVGGPTLASLEEAVAHLRSRVGSADPGVPVRIDLDELRRRCGGDARLVREVGGWLGRHGALVRSDRGPTGSAWWLDAVRLGTSSAGAPPVDTADADVPQPS
ncbi:MAG TPA: DUF87 domain-containing protein [Thermoplasmata archaeon]|nr:DUF87 domain-containing protein [Thermoplasmata archaeon]